ncbi:uncharacterized protein YPO0396 [Rhodococcus sp. OAS809]|uniref:hypothetical protein n=1 Tax=Rhodococcus sp. OAS809 TaxID=2663874 RepID=UPI00178B5186
MTGIDIEDVKAQWMRPRSHRLLVQGWSSDQADKQLDQWWLTSTEGRLVAEVEQLRARVAQSAVPTLVAENEALHERLIAALGILHSYNDSDDGELPECEPEDCWRLYRDLLALLTPETSSEEPS